MKVIYVAGKYRGPSSWHVEQNIRAAEAVALQVWQAGMVAFCPHANSRHMEGAVEGGDEVFLRGTMELLHRCDAVIVVNNWLDSAGARAEVEEARRRGLPILFAWADEGRCFDILDDFRDDKFDPSLCVNDAGFYVGRYA